MSIFWSSWITILSVLCWLCIIGTLLFVLLKKPKLEEDGTTGHTYDGISEYDKPLPKWWVVIFAGSIVWAVGYWIFFPALAPKYWDGIATVKVDGEDVPWTSTNELYSELEDNDEKFTQNFQTQFLPNQAATAELAQLASLQKEYRNSEEPSSELKKQIDEQVNSLAPYVKELAGNQSALMAGERLFLQNCSVCHGSNAKGGVGYPNLTDNDWLYGGEPEHILTTLHNGRIGGMPAWRQDIGEDGVRAASEYVLSLSEGKGSPENGELDSTMVAQGEAIFKAQCALCHGEDGKGMISAGAPNLTDEIWLYGGERETVRDTLRHGKAGVMPAWDTKLGNERIMLLAAYVYSLSNNASSEVVPMSAEAMTSVDDVQAQ